MTVTYHDCDHLVARWAMIWLIIERKKPTSMSCWYVSTVATAVY